MKLQRLHGLLLVVMLCLMSLALANADEDEDNSPPPGMMYASVLGDAWHAIVLLPRNATVLDLKEKVYKDKNYGENFLPSRQHYWVRRPRPATPHLKDEELLEQFEWRIIYCELSKPETEEAAAQEAD